MDVGARIRQLREKIGYSQNKLAEWSGVSQTHLRRVELGQAGITVDHLEMLCDALGISLKEFFSTPPEGEDFSAATANLTPKQKQLLFEFLKSL